MAIAADTPVSEGVQRGRGGFYRSIDGKPYVSDPSGATVKSGKRKGEIKRLAYGSPSNRGMQIENSTNLVKWGERRVVLGVALDPTIAAQCTELTGLDVDSDEYKTLADAIIVRAKEVAKANLAADRGTHVHALTEDHDESRDWVRRAEAGEILGLDPELQNALVDGWNRMLDREGLEVLAVEASCVDDRWRLAGTLDRIVRTSRPLRFARHGGEIAEIPAGTVVVLDVKTSNKRLDRNGCVQYWNAYAIQIASYAQAVPYDTEAETRGEWPFEIDQTHAVIAHPDIETAEWELIYCDLEAGREHGGECVVTAKSWEARSDVFSVAQLDVTQESQGTSGKVDSRTAALTIDPSEGMALELPDADSSASRPSSTPITIVDHWLIRELAAAPDDAAAATAGDGIVRTSAAPANIEPGQVPPTSPARAEPSILDPVRLAAAPVPEVPIGRDEGSTVHLDEAFNEINALYKTLDDDAKAWLGALGKQAMQAGVSFHSHNNRTERRFWIIRGLIVMGIAGLAEDEVLRALVALAMDSDAPLFASIKPGYALGALGAAEAQRFSQLVDQVEEGALKGRISDDGVFVFTPGAAA